jgi:hypothetical protein
LIEFIAAIVILAIGYSLGRHLTRLTPGHYFQNRGEAALSRALLGRFMPPDYHLLNHVTLPHEGETTQIDHVLVSRYGVFVIETKDFTGHIIAGLHGRHWTQVRPWGTFQFQNPIHQNYRHVCAVRELLDFLPASAIQSIVVFTGDAKFESTMPEGVFRLWEFLAYVEHQTTEVMSANRVQLCVGRLELTRLAISKTTDVEHVQRLRSKYGNKD